MPTGTRSSISANSATNPSDGNCVTAHGNYSTGLIWYWQPNSPGWKISR